jgi:hypothetical protein
MNTTTQETSVQRTVREHEELRRRMEGLRTRAERASSSAPGSAPGPATAALVAALEEFRSLLVAHFAFEEESGLPEDLALKLPYVSEKTHSLRREHARILGELETLAGLGRTAAPASAHDVARFGAGVLHLIDTVSRHEENETDLIQDAYLDDLGRAD